MWYDLRPSSWSPLSIHAIRLNLGATWAGTGRYTWLQRSFTKKFLPVRISSGDANKRSSLLHKVPKSIKIFVSKPSRLGARAAGAFVNKLKLFNRPSYRKSRLHKSGLELDFMREKVVRR